MKRKIVDKKFKPRYKNMPDGPGVYSLLLSCGHVITRKKTKVPKHSVECEVCKAGFPADEIGMSLIDLEPEKDVANG